MTDTLDGWCSWPQCQAHPALFDCSLRALSCTCVSSNRLGSAAAAAAVDVACLRAYYVVSRVRPAIDFSWG